MADDIFGETNTENTEITLDALVGEGKKFKTVDDLARGKVASDEHIKNLESELAEARKELRSRTNLEELVAALQQTPGETQMISQEPGAKKQDEPANVTKEVNLQEEVRKLLAAEKTKEQQDANIAAVRKGLVERFGADYNNRLSAVADTLGVSIDFLRDIGVKSPAGLFKLVDSIEKPAADSMFVAPPTRRDPARSPEPVEGIRTKKYYDDIRKKDINLWMSKEIQKQLHNDAMRLGDKFFA